MHLRPNAREFVEKESNAVGEFPSRQVRRRLTLAQAKKGVKHLPLKRKQRRKAMWNNWRYLMANSGGR